MSKSRTEVEYANGQLISTQQIRLGLANPEHVRLVQNPHISWNHWRAKNPHVLPDLAGTNFCAQHLTFKRLDDADFSRCNLMGCRLEGSDLSRANLTDAKLGYAILHGALLREVNISGADFSHVELNRTDFTGAFSQDVQSALKLLLILAADYHKHRIQDVQAEVIAGREEDAWVEAETANIDVDAKDDRQQIEAAIESWEKRQAPVKLSLHSFWSVHWDGVSKVWRICSFGTKQEIVTRGDWQCPRRI